MNNEMTRVERDRKESRQMLASFQKGVSADAMDYLVGLVGEPKARQAATRIAMAFDAAVRTSKSPEALMNCTLESIVACVANSALTGLMPGGAMPLVWLVPKAPRRGAAPEMQWWLSHRGISTLAIRAGYHLIPVPVAAGDIFKVEFGECTLHEPDPEVYPAGLDDLSGVYVTIRRLSDGAPMGRPWMPLAAIQKRHKLAMTEKVWRAWPIEMALKSAIRWTMARGYVPVDDIELQTAMSVEARADEQPRTAVAQHPQIADLGVGEGAAEAEQTRRYDEAMKQARPSAAEAEHEHVELDKAETTDDGPPVDAYDDMPS